MIVSAYLSESATYNDEHRQLGHVTYPVSLVFTEQRSGAVPPVVLVLHQPKTVAEMPPGEIQAPPERVDALATAGYACSGMVASHLKAYWDDARARPVKTHWHPQARLVLF
jgi:hypothetical protein